jgi:hypothetical protein
MKHLIALVVCIALCISACGSLPSPLSQPTAAPANGGGGGPDPVPRPPSPVTAVPSPSDSASIREEKLGAAPVIYLAGRTDIAIPAPDAPSDLPLFSCNTVNLVQETYPVGYRIASGSSFTFSASGRINFYGGSPDEGFPPDGAPDGSLASIESLGGISGYDGPAGALVGVFLDDAVPDGVAPPALDFTPDGTGINFARLTPQIGQVFFIGDGRTDKGETQTFVAPDRATRLFIGLADGAFFVGPPSCYEDNAGSFTYEMRSDQPVTLLP